MINNVNRMIAIFFPLDFRILALRGLHTEKANIQIPSAKSLLSCFARIGIMWTFEGPRAVFVCIISWLPIQDFCAGGFFFILQKKKRWQELRYRRAGQNQEFGDCVRHRICN